MQAQALPPLPDTESIHLVAEMVRTIPALEGYSSTVYLDSEGVPTIGYGHRCRIDHTTVTREGALDMLHADIKLAIANARLVYELQQECTYDLLPMPVQQGLAHMSFQLGRAGLAKFRKTLALLRRGSFVVAALEALDSKWARQTPARARTVAAYFLGVRP